jgi:hypothetical protein
MFHARPARLAAAAAAILAIATATACGTSEKSLTTSALPAPAALSITSPTDGVQIKGNTVALSYSTAGIEIVKANGDTSGTTGHVHVFIDRDPTPTGAVIPKEPGIVHSADNPLLLTGLMPGHHRLIAVMGDGAHRRIGNSQAAVQFDVQGPSLQASAPATVTAGQPAVITVETQNVQLVEANGDVSGTTGHLHIFIDRDPTPAGQAIPKGVPGIIHTTKTTISLPDLTPGEHTVWIVLGNGAHIPFDPPVEDKVTITVTQS